VTGEQFVRFWLHVGLVGLDGKKMSKSLGNLLFVGDLAATSEPAAVRVALLAHHYRLDWEWHPDDLAKAQSRLATWRTSAACSKGDGAIDDVRAALDDDLDTPRALAAIDAAAQSGHGVATAAALLGVIL
jgi:L-cysteine:1D-myo-inositol 2-amino-2-deoxy-alpha-D-glucopyranoside ligase